MKELRIPTRRVTVDVFTTDGATARGYLYHAESMYEHGTAEDIVDELNDEREFIPFHHENGGTGAVLLNKLHIVRLRVHELCEKDLDHPGAEEPEDAESCTLWLTDGSHLTGRPVVETPSGSSRLIDKFNHASPFMIVVSNGGVDFVRADHVVRIVGNK